MAGGDEDTAAAAAAVRRTPLTPGVWAVSHTELDSYAATNDDVAATDAAQNAADGCREGMRTAQAAAPLAAGAAAASMPRVQQQLQPVQPLELVTDVTFCWRERASSAFLTGTFNNWEATVPMSQVTTAVSSEGDAITMWAAVKSLPPGEYQYKFIIDNEWRHAPDQPTTYDERGIINNTLSVTLECCGDRSCFCYRLQHQLDQRQLQIQLEQRQRVGGSGARRESGDGDDNSGAGGMRLMTPNTQRSIQSTTGVAFKYRERASAPRRRSSSRRNGGDPQHQQRSQQPQEGEHSLGQNIGVEDGGGSSRRDGGDVSASSHEMTFMHNRISDRPFDVTVVSVRNLAEQLRIQQQAAAAAGLDAGTISRVSSVEDLTGAVCAAVAANASSNCIDADDSVVDGDNNSDGVVQAAGAAIPMRFDPTLPMYRDAAYAAALRNQGDLGDSVPRTAPNYATLSVSDPLVLAFSVRARLLSPRLGFDPEECHEGILLSESQHCAMRTQERGLYKTVRAKLPIRAAGSHVYYEMYVIQPSAGGGVCVGLSTPELPVSCLCGTRPNSLGFSSSGNLIRTVHGKESWTEFTVPDLEKRKRFTVGVLVKLGRSGGVSVAAMPSSTPFTEEQQQQLLQQPLQQFSQQPPQQVGALAEQGAAAAAAAPKVDSLAAMEARVRFFVDGEEVGVVPYTFRGTMEVFPTLSLFARNARVFAVFGASEMLHANAAVSRINGEVQALDGTPIPRNSETALAWKNSIHDLEQLSQE